MSPEQEAELVNGGDCRSHFHIDDRQPSQSFLQGLQGVANRVPIAANTTLTGREDFVSVDTSAGNVTLNMPIAKQGLEIEILKLSLLNTVILLPQGADTILLTAGVTITVGNAAVRFKAFGTDWRPI